MATNPRHILRNLVVSLDGQVLGTGASNISAAISRTKVPREEYEQPGKFNDKGDWVGGAKLEDSWGLDNEKKLLALLADTAELSDVLFLLRSNTQASPMDVPGGPALFFVCQTVEVPASSTVKGALKKLTAAFEPADGRQPNFGRTLYTSRAKTPAPLTAAGGVVVSDPINLGVLAAGLEIAFSCHCHSVTGTAVVTVLVELLHDVDHTFSTPLVAATLALFTNETPPTGGHLLAPKAQTLVLDGDVTPLPGEGWWAIRATVVDAGADGKAEITAAANLLAK